MNFNQVILILFINIFTIVNAKNGVDEIKDKNCVELQQFVYDNKLKYRLKYKSYSFIDNTSYSYLTDCYYKTSDDLIICNDTYLHYVYIFKLPLNSYKGYGIDTSNNICHHNSTEISSWNLIHDKVKLPKKEFDFEYLKNKDERIKYSFELIFKNNCIYNLSLQDLDYLKTYKFYACIEGEIKKL
eukprot:jgi/Orpsp1_1/1181147/evm.model.c7180000076077.1